MPDRLSAPMHSGTVAIFGADAAFAAAKITDLVERHLAEVPRFRQRVRAVPGGVRNPVWSGPGAGRGEGASGGVASYFVDLPVGEPDPVVRLHQVGHRMKAHNLAGERVGADVLTGLTGFAPPTLHALGTRVSGGLSRRIHNLVITNAPGRRSRATRPARGCWSPTQSCRSRPGRRWRSA